MQNNSRQQHNQKNWKIPLPAHKKNTFVDNKENISQNVTFKSKKIKANYNTFAKNNDSITSKTILTKYDESSVITKKKAQSEVIDKAAKDNIKLKRIKNNQKVKTTRQVTLNIKKGIKKIPGESVNGQKIIYLDVYNTSVNKKSVSTRINSHNCGQKNTLKDINIVKNNHNSITINTNSSTYNDIQSNNRKNETVISPANSNIVPGRTKQIQKKSVRDNKYICPYISDQNSVDNYKKPDNNKLRNNTGRSSINYKKYKSKQKQLTIPSPGFNNSHYDNSYVLNNDNNNNNTYINKKMTRNCSLESKPNTFYNSFINSYNHNIFKHRTINDTMPIPNKSNLNELNLFNKNNMNNENIFIINNININNNKINNNYVIGNYSKDKKNRIKSVKEKIMENINENDDETFSSYVKRNLSSKNKETKNKENKENICYIDNKNKLKNKLKELINNNNINNNIKDDKCHMKNCVSSTNSLLKLSKKFGNNNNNEFEYDLNYFSKLNENGYTNLLYKKKNNIEDNINNINDNNKDNNNKDNKDHIKDKKDNDDKNQSVLYKTLKSIGFDKYQKYSNSIDENIMCGNLKVSQNNKYKEKNNSNINNNKNITIIGNKNFIRKISNVYKMSNNQNNSTNNNTKYNSQNTMNYNSNIIKNNKEEIKNVEIKNKCSETICVNSNIGSNNAINYKKKLIYKQAKINPGVAKIISTTDTNTNTLNNNKNSSEKNLQVKVHPFILKTPEENKNEKKNLQENSLLNYEINYNPQIPIEYLPSIYEYLKETEGLNLPKFHYMRNVQNDLSEKMRIILLDWLVEVHEKYKMTPETLFLTVGIIDRFLSKVSINRKEFQLLGVTAMQIACKYEEIYPPETKEFAYLTDGAYTKEQILDMEYLVLKYLDFNITYPSSLRLLEIFKEKLNLNNKTYCRCLYLIENALLSYSCCGFKPSEIAASAIYMIYRKFNKEFVKESKNKNNNEGSTKNCNENTTPSVKDDNNSDIIEFDYLKSILEYNEKELEECTEKIKEEVQRINDTNCKYKILKDKFSTKKFEHVSMDDYL